VDEETYNGVKHNKKLLVSWKMSLQN